MKTRSSIPVISAEDAPRAVDVLPPPTRIPGSFDILAIPNEVRKNILENILTNSGEISLNVLADIYVIIHADETLNPDRMRVRERHEDEEPLRTTMVECPATFVFHNHVHPRIQLVTPMGTATVSRPNTNPSPSNVIPPSNVVSGGIYWFITYDTILVRRDRGPPTCGAYIGPMNRLDMFSYLPYNACRLDSSFNPKIIQTCKTLYAEGLPMLYRHNSFVHHLRLHEDGYEDVHILHSVSGRSLSQIKTLRLQARNFRDLLKHGSQGIWSTVLDRCLQLETVTLAFNSPRSFLLNMVGFAYCITNVRAGVAEPRLIVRGRIPPAPATHQIAHWAWTKTEDVLRSPPSGKIQLPVGRTLVLQGPISVPDFRMVQAYARKKWHFKRTSPDQGSVGDWVELKWVKA